MALNQALNRPADEVSDSTLRRINSAADALVAYMLFADEAPLDGRIAGASGFSERANQTADKLFDTGCNNPSLVGNLRQSARFQNGNHGCTRLRSLVKERHRECT